MLRSSLYQNHMEKIMALDKVSLRLTPGIHGLLGPNGAGKTTIMRILATILDADEGEITWGDLSWKAPRKIKGKIGYLPQQFGMYQYVRVREALLHVALLKNIPRSQENLQVDLALERAHLTEFATRKVSQLSGGMLRRLGVAQAIIGEPPLLILDEPSVGLDPAERIHLRKLIRDYADGNRIVLISSHIVNDVESLCDTVSVMDQGKVLVSDKMAQVRALSNHHVKEEVMSVALFRELEGIHTVISFDPIGSEYRVRYLVEDAQQEAVANVTLEDSYTYLLQRTRP